jgi:hypothetical protein
MQAPEGWPAFVIARVAADVAARSPCFGRGGEYTLAPTWPGGPKEGSRRPARHAVPPGGQPAAGGSCAALRQGLPRAALSRCGGQLVWRAPRALEDVENFVTGGGLTLSHVIAGLT